jgi:CHAT domain-containing protein/Tfp pilus assembly protein PilF
MSRKQVDDPRMQNTPLMKRPFLLLFLVVSLATTVARGDEPGTEQTAQRIQESKRLLGEAETLRNQGKLDAAVAKAKEARVAVRAAGKLDIQTGLVERFLAEVYEEQEKYDLALAAREEHLKVATQVFGERDFRTIYARTNLQHCQKLTGLTAAQRKRLKEAADKDAQAARLLDQQRTDAAIPLMLEVVKILQEVLGEEDWYTATFLVGIARRYRAIEDDRHAEVYFRRALAVRKKLFGEEHPEYLQVLVGLATTFNSQFEYTQAEPLLVQARNGYRKTIGENDARYILCMFELGATYAGKQDFAQAEQCLTVASAYFKRTAGEDSFDYHNCLDRLAAVYHASGDQPRALEVRKKCAEWAKRKYGDTRPGYPYFLNHLAQEYEAMGEYSRAIAAYNETIEVHKKIAPNSPNRATFLFNLSHVYSEMGDRAQAQRFLNEANEIWKKAYGERHPSYLHVLDKMATHYRKSGEYDQAEKVLKQALETCQQTLGPTHIQTAAFLEGLGQLYQRIGDYEKAEPFFRKTLEIRREKLGESHGDTIHALVELGKFLRLRADTRMQGYELLEEALEKTRKRFGESHPRYAHLLAQIATEYNIDRDFERAQPLYVEALRIAKANQRENTPQHAYLLRNYGMLLFLHGDYAEAEDLLNRAAAITKKTGQARENELAELYNMACLAYATGQFHKALDIQLQAMTEEQRDLRSTFRFTAESSMNGSMRAVSIQGSLARLISMVLSNDLPDSDGAKLVLTWVLRRKGIVLDTLCRFRTAQRLQATNPELQEKASRWRMLRQQIANSALNRRGLDADALKRQVAAWTEEADRLESELNRAAAGRTDTQEADVDAVRAQLPPGSALIEILREMPYDFKPIKNGKRWKPRHYYAFVLAAGNENKVILIDLGLAAPIDAAVSKLREQIQATPRALRTSSEKDLEAEFAKTSADVYRRLFAPIQKHLGKETLLFIAPDGDLNRLPFEALVDEQGKYLVERYRIAYLASGRDLLRPKAAPAQGTVVFAGPDYDLKSKERVAQAEKLKVKAPAEAVALRGGAAPELRGMRWKPLRGAAAEASDVTQALNEGEYGPVRAYRGPEAIEEALKAMKAPRILHLATHGFFLPDEQKKDEGEDAPEVGAAAGMARLRRFSNPLLRSGIVLAGANALGEEGATGEDGWVTAEEISLLDLRGTELVVLSACESGLGDVKAGEGVFGLRRAFLYAGARTLLNSLFEVPDTQTREMMRSFYGGMKAGKGKLESLHAAQLEMIRRRRQEQQAAHPFFWASFVLVGDPK